MINEKDYREIYCANKRECGWEYWTDIINEREY
jgi:hypothetical protein